VSVNEYTEQLAECKFWHCVTGDMQPSTAFCMWVFPTVSTVQHLVAQVHSDFSSLRIQNGNVFVYCDKIWDCSREGERIETYRNGV
jgi:hypothetical protein